VKHFACIEPFFGARSTASARPVTSVLCAAMTHVSETRHGPPGRQSYWSRDPRFLYANMDIIPVPNKTNDPGSGVVWIVPLPDEVNVPSS
jgi:hypothetical protein